MMNEKIEWTQKLGDAFLSQQKDVMASAQRLPTEGAGIGKPQDTKEQKVIVRNNESDHHSSRASPQAVYDAYVQPDRGIRTWPYPALSTLPVYLPLCAGRFVFLWSAVWL